MVAPRRTGRSRLTLALLVITSLAVLTLDFRDAGPVRAMRDVAATVFSPLRGVAEAAGRPFSNAWGGITDYGDLKDENEALRERLDELEGAGALEADSTTQLKEVLAQQGVGWVQDVDRTQARVVAGSLSNFTDTIELDKGRSAGVREGMPVVTSAGLVGLVVQATADRATVQLLTDGDFRVGVRLADDGTQGTARGTGSGNDLRVDTSLAPDAEVPEGAAIVTSGTDRSRYPAGIPVAEVTGTRPAENGLTLDLLARPAADLDRLSYVTVLLVERPG